ncbi:DedA family protein [Desulfosarcina cetonica]|uniref:DedA family protein n=1 Tax=Desulfosarcina cetonica TaxID=90730 RepID=UPI00155D8964|nr:DedA family protein [Desulfosarcina cetonica]
MHIFQPYLSLVKAFFAHLGADAASTLQHYLVLAQPLLDAYGYLAVFVTILIEGAGIPAPGQTLLMAASFLAARGKMSLAAVLSLSFVACVLGNTGGYAIGRWGGRRLLFKARVSAVRLDKIEKQFDRYGGWVVFVGRFFDGLRQLNGIVAGTLHMPFFKFTVFNVLGALAWTGLWGGGLYFLEKDVKVVYAFFHSTEPYVILATLLTVIVLVRYLRRHRNSPSS